jgi:hypothetical protein
MLKAAPGISRLISTLCALTLVFLGLESALMAMLRLDPALAAYVQAGGEIKDLCRSADERSGQVQHDTCPACTLAKALDVAAPQTIRASYFLNSTHPAVRVQKLGLGPKLSGCPPARAPPVRAI